MKNVWLFSSTNGAAVGFSGRAAHQTARAYQTFEDKGKTILRVLVGRYGYRKEFADPNDPSLK